jgi:hypothetical protein
VRSRLYILDVTGEAIAVDDPVEWGKWMQTGDRKVSETRIDGVLISTVFLGVDHNFREVGPQILWETMIFGGKHDQYQDRYTSRADAVEGHLKAVAMIVEGRGAKPGEGA